MTPWKNSSIHKKSFNKGKSQAMATVNTEENKFKDILNRKWKIFRVSPMYNFSSNQLKDYGKKLSQELKTKKSENLKCKFNLKEDLNETCSKSLQVEIIADEVRRVYLGHFISWSDSTPNNDFVTFPILLVEAKAHIIPDVHSFFCKLFDCDIQPVTLPMHALVFFLVKLLEAPRTDTDLSQAQIKMEYKVPGCEDNDRIEITLYLESTTVIFAVVMESLRKEFPEITNMEIICEFYNKLLNHMYNIYQIDFTYAELHKVSFPDAFLILDGQVKMSTIDAALTTLYVLKRFTPLDAVVNL